MVSSVAIGTEGTGPRVGAEPGVGVTEEGSELLVKSQATFVPEPVQVMPEL